MVCAVIDSDESEARLHASIRKSIFAFAHLILTGDTLPPGLQPEMASPPELCVGVEYGKRVSLIFCRNVAVTIIVQRRADLGLNAWHCCFQVSSVNRCMWSSQACL